MAAQIRALLASSPSPSLPSSASPRWPSLSQNDGAPPPCLSRLASGNPLPAFSQLFFASPHVASSAVGSVSSKISHSFEQVAADDGGNGRGSSTGSNGDGSGGGGGGEGSHGGQGSGDSQGPGGIFGALLKGWNDRVRADREFPFKVLMEEVVGVGACVIGDMASRPNFGLNELDFVFSTMVVGSILNFSLMYMLAPTYGAASAASALPFMFSSCPPAHMFQHGAFSLVDRLGTFVYKGAIFATVGFAAGLLGTAISNSLIGLRRSMDPARQTDVKAPPTVLNAATWAVHMGLSSNLRYQVVNGLEFAMANSLPPALFKASVFCIRAANNVLGGMSFVLLARLTGSQKAEVPKAQTRLQMSALQSHEATEMNGEEPLKEKSSSLLKGASATDVVH